MRDSFLQIQSVGYNQDEILSSIQYLHCPDGFDCDISYGNGKFYHKIDKPKRCFDIEPLLPHVVKSCSTNLPLSDTSVGSVVFDPPFLTYIKAGRNHGSLMGKRFGGYWTYEELMSHYIGTLKEVSRVLKKKGILVFKCQDIIHNHKMHCTHAMVIEEAKKVGFRLKDIFILAAKNRMPVKAAKHGRQSQQHARIHHSYFLVFLLEAKP